MTTLHDLARMGAMLTMVGLRRGACFIGRRLDLAAYQEIERTEDPWSYGEERPRDSWDARGELIYMYDADCPMRTTVYSPLRWGRWVLAVEWSPDGGGTTHLLMADAEADYATMSATYDVDVEAWHQRMDAR